MQRNSLWGVSSTYLLQSWGQHSPIYVAPSVWSRCRLGDVSVQSVSGTLVPSFLSQSIASAQAHYDSVPEEINSSLLELSSDTTKCWVTLAHKLSFSSLGLQNHLAEQ